MAVIANNRRTLRRLSGNKGGLIGLIALALIVAAALAAPWISPLDPTKQNIIDRLEPPALFQGGDPRHWLGTDHLGRDIFWRIIWGARISLSVGILAVLVSGTVGVTLGMLAGFYRGWLDRVIMRLCDIQLSMPFVLLAISIVAVMGRGLTNLVVALAVTGWVSYARVVRAQVLSLREVEFVTAARAVGAGDPRLLLRYILPNVAPTVIVIASIAVAQMIILESALSFLGLGVPPPTPTWGGMLADAREYLSSAGWVGLYPGLAILITVLSVNLMGDALRDALDPSIQL